MQIVVTGLGAVTPVGIGAEVSYRAMCEGKSGIVKLPSWADEYPAQVISLMKQHIIVIINYYYYFTITIHYVRFLNL